MAYLAKKIAAILWEGLAEKKENEQEEIIKNFLTILNKKRKLHLLKEITEELEKIKQNKETKLILSRPLDPQTIKLIQEKVKKYFNQNGNWKIKIEKEIIGGFIIKNQTFLIDASIKKILNKIFNKL